MILNFILKFVVNVPKGVGKILIRIYQKLFSFDHAFWAGWVNYRVCLHTPSCSQYTYEAIDKFGLVKGSIMGFFRIMRCTPWNPHTHDPVPDIFSIKPNVTRSHTNL